MKFFKRRRTYTVAWIVWVLWFVFWEAMALINKVPKGTFSEHVWDIQSLESVLFFGIGGIATWVAVHFTIEAYIRMRKRKDYKAWFE